MLMTIQKEKRKSSTLISMNRKEKINVDMSVHAEFKLELRCKTSVRSNFENNKLNIKQTIGM